MPWPKSSARSAPPPKDWPSSGYRRQSSGPKTPLPVRPLPCRLPARPRSRPRFLPRRRWKSQSSVSPMRTPSWISAASRAPCRRAARRKGRPRNSRSFHRRARPWGASHGFQAARPPPASSRNTGPSRRAAIRPRPMCRRRPCPSRSAALTAPWRSRRPLSRACPPPGSIPTLTGAGPRTISAMRCRLRNVPALLAAAQRGAPGPSL